MYINTNKNHSIFPWLLTRPMSRIKEAIIKKKLLLKSSYYLKALEKQASKLTVDMFSLLN